MENPFITAHENPDGSITGLTLRDLFAGLAMTGDMAAPTTDSFIGDVGMACASLEYYKMADAMLEAREVTD